MYRVIYKYEYNKCVNQVETVEKTDKSAKVHKQQKNNFVIRIIF